MIWQEQLISIIHVYAQSLATEPAGSENKVAVWFLDLFRATNQPKDLFYVGHGGRDDRAAQAYRIILAADFNKGATREAHWLLIIQLAVIQ